MTSKIVIFNHKGGVGKTTLTVNIAAALAILGKRVLLVDADPQCNMSSYLLDANVLDNYLDKSDTEQGRTLWSAVQKVAEGSGEVKIVEPIELSDGVLLIPGDVRMSEFEIELSEFWNQATQRRKKGYRGVSAISSLISNVVDEHNVDVVMFDIGPNIGPLNKTILLGCDAFAVPVACDIFSLRALKTVGRILVQWIEDWEIIRELAPSSFNLMEGKPKLLGYLPQQFRVYRGSPTKAQQNMINEIDMKIRSDVVRVLSDSDPDLVNETSNSSIGKVQDYGSIIPVAQTKGKAIWEVQAHGNETKNEFVNLAKTILKRVR